MGEVIVAVPARAGTSEKWAEWVILRPAPENNIVLDLAELEFADPLFLIRLRAFIDWHCDGGKTVRVIAPRRNGVKNYLCRMGLADDLPAGCECDLGSVDSQDRSDVLISITRLADQRASDLLGDYPLDVGT
jgi:hypothetical protein